MVELPETRFAVVGDDRIAYQAIGHGPPDILYTSGSGGHIDVALEYPRFQYMVARFASFGRLIRFDRRSAGASDPLSRDVLPSWETWIDDFKAVLDAVGSERVAIVALLDAAAPSLMFAATYPERTHALVLFNTTACYRARPDYPEGLPDDVVDSVMDRIRSQWGTEDYGPLVAPSIADDKSFARWYAKLMRAGASPRVLAENLEQALDMDAREVLPSIKVPVLVMHSRDNALTPFAQGRYLAENLPNARFIELPGADGLILGAHMDRVLGEIETFLTGARRVSNPDRVLATVLFTDIVGSTERLADVGDKQWRHTLETHDSTIRSSVESFNGQVAQTTGDGVFALFDGPGRALQCALTLRERLASLGLAIRTGIHTGEVELRSQDLVSGIAVHIAARVMAQAGPGEVLVSRTVRDLVTGGGFEFESRGAYELKGVPDKWELCAVSEGSSSG